VIAEKNVKCLLNQTAASRFFAEIVSREKELLKDLGIIIFLHLHHQGVLILTTEAQIKHHRHLLTKKNLQP
jgi:hypothetical protein